jgi:chaperone required for assembly of F1-ATPase
MIRFYKDAGLSKTANGYAVTLDGKHIKTPAGKVLELTSKPLAEAIADEWQGQIDKVDIKSMSLTTLSYAAIDQVGNNRALIEAEVGAYAGADLICYRAEAPLELRQKEEAAWNPIVTWLNDEHGLDLKTVTGLSYVRQDEKIEAFMSNYLAKQDMFILAALQRITGLLGSLFLSMAVEKDKISAENAWQISRVDEAYQAELWGEDVEADVEVAKKHANFNEAIVFLSLSKA